MYFFLMQGNGWQYEIVGDCRLLSCSDAPNFDARTEVRITTYPQIFYDRVLHVFYFDVLQCSLFGKIL